MMRRSLSEARIVSGRDESRPRKTTWALADHAYAAPSPRAKRRRHFSLPMGETPARCTPPTMQVTVGPPTKRRPLDTATSEFIDGGSNSGDSFRKPDTRVFYTPPDARSDTSAAGQLDPLQSWLSTDSTQQTGRGHSQLSFTLGQTQRAFRRYLLVERFTPNEHIDSLALFLQSLRESSQHRLTQLMAEHYALNLWVGVDVQYRHMFEERVATGHHTHTAVLHYDFQINEVFSRLGEEVQMRNANFLRNASLSCWTTMSQLCFMWLAMP